MVVQNYTSLLAHYLLVEMSATKRQWAKELEENYIESYKDLIDSFRWDEVGGTSDQACNEEARVPGS